MSQKLLQAKCVFQVCLWQNSSFEVSDFGISTRLAILWKMPLVPISGNMAEKHLKTCEGPAWISLSKQVPFKQHLWKETQTEDSWQQSALHKTTTCLKKIHEQLKLHSCFSVSNWNSLFDFWFHFWLHGNLQSHMNNFSHVHITLGNSQIFLRATNLQFCTCAPVHTHTHTHTHTHIHTHSHMLQMHMWTQATLLLKTKRQEKLKAHMPIFHLSVQTFMKGPPTKKLEMFWVDQNPDGQFFESSKVLTNCSWTQKRKTKCKNCSQQSKRWCTYVWQKNFEEWFQTDHKFCVLLRWCSLATKNENGCERSTAGEFLKHCIDRSEMAKKWTCWTQVLILLWKDNVWPHVHTCEHTHVHHFLVSKEQADMCTIFSNMSAPVSQNFAIGSQQTISQESHGERNSSE